MAEDEKKDLRKVRLRNVRISFAHVYEPQEGKIDKETQKKGKDRYNCNLLIAKTDKTNIAACKIGANAAKADEWGDDEKKWPKLKAEKVFLRDGDQENYDGYEGMLYASAGNEQQPKLVDRIRGADGKWMPSPAGQIYSGCYVNATIRIWAQDNEYGKRVNASLEAVQFLRAGPAFGAKPVDAEEEFGDDDVSDFPDEAEAGDGDSEDLI